MKKIFKSLSVVLLTVLAFSCTESDNPVDKVLKDTHDDNFAIGFALSKSIQNNESLIINNNRIRFCFQILLQ